MGARFANAALAFASATMITVVIHEGAHGLVAQALGFAPKIYPFVENNPTGTPLQDILIAAGGPIGSLLTGLLFAWLYARGRPRYGFWRVLLCWLAFQGIIEFVNYLIVTPWLAAGDTAVICDRLGLGIVPRYAIAAIGVVILIALGGWAAQMMYACAPRSVALDERRERVRYISRSFYLPAFAGLLLVALAAIGGHPVYVFYGLLGAFGSIDIAGVALGATRRPALRRSEGQDAPERIAPAAVAVYLLLLCFYVVVLVHGVPV